MNISFRIRKYAAAAYSINEVSSIVFQLLLLFVAVILCWILPCYILHCVNKLCVLTLTLTAQLLLFGYKNKERNPISQHQVFVLHSLPCLLSFLLLIFVGVWLSWKVNDKDKFKCILRRKLMYKKVEIVFEIDT